jgi:hypothetical protein
MQVFDDSTLKRAKNRGRMPAQWAKICAAIVTAPHACVVPMFLPVL